MSNQVKCFFAYPSYPPALSEVLENAIQEINKLGQNSVVIQGWKTLGVTGNPIIIKICEAIDESQVFICDLTRINPNVLFELGYAIARNRRIWITLDTSFGEEKSNFEKLSLLSGIGYVEYQNRSHLVTKFFQERPYEDLESTLYTKTIQSENITKSHSTSILYLKSRIETEASRELSRLLDKVKISLRIDDPQENNSQTLAWYIQSTQNSAATIAHLLDDTRDNRFNQNAKYSFVAGMSYGFGKPLLMLAHTPFKPPVDYSDLLFIHDTAKSCITHTSSWLTNIIEVVETKKQIIKEQTKEFEDVLALQRISIGEDIAENEQIDLLKYFVETSQYQESLRGPQSLIFVGRKGCGKTANLIKISDTLSNNKRNHVCVIKPVAYELEGIIRLLRLTKSKAEQGFMLESLWKFLIYTELAFSVYSEIESKPLHYTKSSHEVSLYDYVEEHHELIKSEFAVRMERAINDLCEINLSDSIEQQRARISEILHHNILNKLREFLGIALEDKEKVCVLIDNLDKSWIKGTDINLLSDFLFALLSVSKAISDDFLKERSKLKPVRLSLMIFIRSDIFSYIMKEARERDKLIHRRLEWTDPLLLQRIVEERFMEASDRLLTREQVWENFFIGNINGIPTKDYLISRVIPRPRDTIYLCRSALAHAINHGHSRIDASDILLAEKEYSQYVFNSLEAETSAQLDYLEELLYEFVGGNKIVSREGIESYLKKVSIPIENAQYAIDLLCESTFLGLETEQDKFEYIYDENRRDIIRALARKTTESFGVERYCINIPFRSYLEIKGA